MVRPVAYDDYNVSNYPTGNNAIVCVIAYTVRNGSCQHLSCPIGLFLLLNSSFCLELLALSWLPIPWPDPPPPML